MSEHSSRAEVKQRMRATAPDATDAEREGRRQAARTATEVYVLGHHLRVIREEQGLTQAQVAKSVGISQARVSHVFPRRPAPSARTAGSQSGPVESPHRP
ncbi:helix-turn-helix transcriptional regulator [Streptomyces anulatus]|uniref:helix-turn-helix transcriptional regulator n=1 Tax=Streptomyces anulatus TaxID=1892 RepID=UPI002256583C|nr:helix-turn-helix transcriptional regulator [Streptomyces anulatus]MCX4508494.1 helix-turn-helix transcriptional regulator [Streptomyces anulatus]